MFYKIAKKIVGHGSGPVYECCKKIYNKLYSLNLFRIPHGEEGIKKLGHREYVGGLWEAMGKLQFNFMIKVGLQPHHYLLDIGCGCLRGGIHFIEYLNKDHYLGMEKEQKLLDQAIKYELSPEIYSEKNPRLIASDSFEFEKFGIKPDYVLAQSLFTHLPVSFIQQCLKKIRANISNHGKFYATFFENKSHSVNPKKPHDLLRFEFTFDEMNQFGEQNGFRVERVDHAYNHPRGQKMVCFHPV